MPLFPDQIVELVRSAEGPPGPDADARARSYRRLPVQIEQSFTIKADPDTVYAFLLDVNRVVGCMPGVQLIEAKSDDTFVGTMKVKVGPVSVQYKGTAQITSRDAATRMATLAAEGTEGVGCGRR